MPDLNRASLRRCRAPLPLAVLTLAMLHAQGAMAQAAAPTDPTDPTDPIQAPLLLKRTPQLVETLPRNERSQRPTFVEGDKISGRPDLETVVEGNASLRRGDIAIRADRLEYDQAGDLAKAQGNVHVNQAGNIYEGPELQLKVESFEGFFNKARYEFIKNGAQGEAERIDFIDANRSIARRATYTTCRRIDLPEWMPSWILRATEIRTDSEENQGEADNAQLTFFGLTTPPLPTVSFPLSNERKSGLLPPIIGINNVNGLEYVQPYYWNIAPNRDATFTPTLMSKRGVNLSNEFRYLEQGYKGEARIDFMPGDTLRDRKRWGIWARHEQTFDAKALGLDSLGGSINLNRVSDDDYWRDFTRTPTLSTRLLANDASLNWAKGDWSGIVRALSYQALQYAPSPIIPPYDRMPQLTANYNKYDWHGFDVSFTADYTRFRGEPTIQLQPNADRVYALGQISRPFLSPSGFIIPKLQLHSASYQFESPLSTGASSATSTVPTFSLDSGLIFERNASFFGRAFRQTLEPRAFYVYTPYRNQSVLPVYDTAANDYNFATVYTENEFSGHDRISATNALTTGVTTRLIDPDTGVEAARFGIAQRYRFSEQNVTLPNGLTASQGFSDLLLGAQINWTPKWSLDTTVRYNQDTSRMTRTAVTARYTPAPYRTINLSYRYQADTTALSNDGTKSIDMSWQWPLNDLWGDKGQNLGPGRGEGGGRWYAVGRLNFSLRENKLTDAVLGVEYDGCCYIARVVLEKLTTGVVTANTRIMFQLEFVGFSSIGASPLRALRLNVPGYTPLRQPIGAPSRFTNYD